MKRVCLLVGVAALAAMNATAEVRTNDVNGVTMVYDVGSEGVRVGSPVLSEPSVAIDTAGAIVVPEMIDGAKVVAIGDYAFSGCSGVTSITLPNTITNIGAYAFSECPSLKNVLLPEGLRCIGGSAFFCCKSLLRIVIPSDVEEIGAKAFGGCVSLQEVEFLGDEPSVGGWDLFTGTPSTLTVLVKKDALGWQNPITYGLLQAWQGRSVSYEGERVVSINEQGSSVDVAALVDSLVCQVTTLGSSLSDQEKMNYLYWLRDLIQSCPTSEEGFDYAGVIDAYMNAVTTLVAGLTDSEKASIIGWTSEYVTKGVAGDTVVTNGTNSGTSSGAGSSSGGGVAAQTVAANLTVTNVVVHYVQEVENVASVATATSGGLVAVVSEVLGSSMMSIPSSWTNSYPQFVEMFGDDFASALMKPSGKVGSDGAALQVWQDYVAGTDPTDPTSRFAATIDFVDGTPVVTWSPNVMDSSRVYRIWGKKSLGDADWTQIDSASTAGYNFFKVTVEMR